MRTVCRKAVQKVLRCLEKCQRFRSVALEVLCMSLFKTVFSPFQVVLGFGFWYIFDWCFGSPHISKKLSQPPKPVDFQFFFTSDSGELWSKARLGYVERLDGNGWEKHLKLRRFSSFLGSPVLMKLISIEVGGPSS